MGNNEKERENEKMHMRERREAERRERINKRIEEIEKEIEKKMVIEQEKKKMKRMPMIERKKVEVEEIINKIIEEISKKTPLPDSVIQDYKEKLSDFLNTFIENYNEEEEFKFEIVSNPYEYAKNASNKYKKIMEDENNMNFKYVEEGYFRRNIIGDSKFLDNGMLNFSLSDIQITLMQVTILKEKCKINEFYKILVYIPKERDEKENTAETFSELKYREETQKRVDKIERNQQETANQIMTEIESNYDLTDSLREEYRKKIQEALKLNDSEIERILLKYSDIEVKVTIERNPHEFATAFYRENHYKVYFNTIGDFYWDSNTKEDFVYGEEIEEIDFSLGVIQVLIEKDEFLNSMKVSLYIPDKAFYEEKYKGIATYKELLAKEEEELKVRIEKSAEEFRSNLAKRLKTETNGYLTEEHIETILNSINFKSFAEMEEETKEREADYCGCTEYPFEMTSNPDEFAKNIGDECIIGDSIKRDLLSSCE